MSLKYWKLSTHHNQELHTIVNYPTSNSKWISRVSDWELCFSAVFSRGGEEQCSLLTVIPTVCSRIRHLLKELISLCVRLICLDYNLSHRMSQIFKTPYQKLGGIDYWLSASCVAAYSKYFSYFCAWKVAEQNPSTFQEDQVSRSTDVRFMQLRNWRLLRCGRKGLVEQVPLYWVAFSI